MTERERIERMISRKFKEEIHWNASTITIITNTLNSPIKDWYYQAGLKK
jgi:hypothetical protein